MKNKTRNLTNRIYASIWFLNLGLMLIYILIPKSIYANNIFYYFFIASFTIIPFVLTLLQIDVYYKAKENSIGIYNLTPALGIFGIIIVYFANLIASLEKQIVAEYIIILLTFISLITLICHNINKHKEYNLKRYILLNVLCFICLIAFMTVSMILAYDYGKI